MELAKYIGNRIRVFRKEKNLTQAELGEMIGAPKARISNYETGYRSPMQDDLFRLAESLDVTINDLFPPTTNKKDIMNIYYSLSKENRKKARTYIEGLLREQELSSHVEEPTITYKIKVLGAVSAGTGEMLQDEHVEIIDSERKVPKHDFALIVNGDSMQPTLQDHEIIFIKQAIEPEFNGQIVIAILNGEGYVKKYYEDENGIRLISMNSNYEDIIVHDYDELEIKGIVIL